MDYASDLGDTSPEGIAQKTANTYRDMMNGDPSPEDGYEILKSYAPADTAAEMDADKADFLENIRTSAGYFEQNGMKIEKFYFSKTYYTEGNSQQSSIYRIQI